MSNDVGTLKIDNKIKESYANSLLKKSMVLESTVKELDTHNKILETNNRRKDVDITLKDSSIRNLAYRSKS